MGNVDNFQDVPFNVDFGLLDGIIYNLTKFSSTVFGLVAIIVAVFTTIITVIDIAYLTYPPLQSFIIKGHLGRDSSKLKIRIISRDAYYAVEGKYKLDVASSGTNYRSAMVIYLRRRARTYLVLGLVFFLLLGGLKTVIPTISNVLEPLFKAFGVYK